MERNHTFSLWVLPFALVALTACSRDQGKSSKITIKFPAQSSAMRMSQAVHSFSTKWLLSDPAMGTDINCYAVAVQSAQVSSSANMCYNVSGEVILSPDMLYGGFPAGTTQELMVSSGANKKIYLIGFHTDSAAACVDVTTSAIGLDKAHFSAPFVLDKLTRDLTAGVVEITLNVPAALTATSKFEDCSPFAFNRGTGGGSGSAQTVTSIVPAVGPISGGNTVVISGTGFLAASSTVTIGGAPCGSPVVTSTSISCTAPSGTPGPANVVVTTGVNVTQMPGDYTYTSLPTITIADRTLAENSGGPNNVVLTLSSAAAADVTVNYSFSSITAVSSLDYVNATGTATILAGTTAATIPLSIVNDSVDENDETFQVDISNPSGNATIADSTAIVTITNDDSPPAVNFSAASQDSPEGTNISVGYSLSQQSGKSITFTYTVTGTAVAGTQFNSPSGSVTIPAGTTSGAINITQTAADGLVEALSTIVLTMSAVTNVTMGATYVHTATILDVDIPAAVTLSNTPASVTNASTLNVTVNPSPHVTEYSYAFGSTCSSYGAWIPIATPITDTIGSNGSKLLCVKGRTSSGVVQASSTDFNFLKDSTAPTITLGSVVPTTTSEESIPVTIAVSEAVTGLVAGDLIISNGTAANFAGSGSSYTFDLIPTATGAVTVDINSNSAQDSAGNGNLVATTLAFTFTMPPGAWTNLSATGVPAAVYDSFSVWMGSKWFVAGGVTAATSTVATVSTYEPSTDTWSARAALSPALSHMQGAWTGKEVIYYGGMNSSGSAIAAGSKYNPTSDTWTALSGTSSPGARMWHSATWSGMKLYVWGGWNGSTNLNTGAAYDPVTDSWVSMSNTGAPAIRRTHAAFSSGTHLVVWGGEGSGVLNSGGRYEYATDSWSATSTAGAPSARRDFSWVWTGDRLIVWGGADTGTNPYADGGIYDPYKDTWLPISAGLPGTPSARFGAKAVWTGTHMVIYGGADGPGNSQKNDAYAFDPYAYTWQKLKTPASLTGRVKASVGWSGSELLVHGGTQAVTQAGLTGAAKFTSANFGAGNYVSKVVVGMSHSCAIGTGGKLKCWGYNTSGQLGIGNTVTKGDSGSEMGANLMAVDLGIGKSALQVALGQSHTCALLNDYSVKCWGLNSMGQLGLGNTTTMGDGPGEMGNALPTIFLGQQAMAVTAGANFSCALLVDGTVKCWGQGTYGNMGNGTTTASNTSPVIVTGLSTATEIAAGDNHACVLASGVIKCWGANVDYQLGDSTAADRSSYVVAHSGYYGFNLSARGSSSCVMTNTTPLCWGKGTDGQFGNASTTAYATIQSVSTSNGPISQLAMGGAHACGIQNGDIACWGNNVNGQLGKENTTDYSSPQFIVGPLTNAVGVSASYNTTCAWYKDATVRCWGANGTGKLGIESGAPSIGTTTGEMTTMMITDLGF